MPSHTETLSILPRSDSARSAEQSHDLDRTTTFRSGGDEGREQLSLLGPVCYALRVPLDAQEEPSVGHLHRFHYSIGCTGQYSESWRRPVHGLMMA